MVPYCGMTQARTTNMPTFNSVVRNLEETLAELEWRATATSRTLKERAKDLEAVETIRHTLEVLRSLQADDMPD
jgi:hypothetical protein